MIERKAYTVEIREGERFCGFYSRDTGKWIRGCRKPYLLDAMVELTNRFYDLYGEETYFVLGEYEDDAKVQKRLKYGATGRSFDD